MFHQRGVAAGPQVTVALNPAAHPPARRFENVLAEHFAVERRQITVPIRDLHILVPRPMYMGTRAFGPAFRPD
jgi:hypothetical protein